MPSSSTESGPQIFLQMNFKKTVTSFLSFLRDPAGRVRCGWRRPWYRHRLIDLLYLTPYSTRKHLHYPAIFLGLGTNFLKISEFSLLTLRPAAGTTRSLGNSAVQIGINPWSKCSKSMVPEQVMLASNLWPLHLTRSTTLVTRSCRIEYKWCSEQILVGKGFFIAKKALK